MLCQHGSLNTTSTKDYKHYLLTVKCIMNKLTQLQYNVITVNWNQMTANPQNHCNVLHFNITKYTNNNVIIPIRPKYDKSRSKVSKKLKLKNLRYTFNAEYTTHM